MIDLGSFTGKLSGQGAICKRLARVMKIYKKGFVDSLLGNRPPLGISPMPVDGSWACERSCCIAGSSTLISRFISMAQGEYRSYFNRTVGLQTRLGT